MVPLGIERFSSFIDDAASWLYSIIMSTQPLLQRTATKRIALPVRVEPKVSFAVCTSGFAVRAPKRLLGATPNAAGVIGESARTGDLERWDMVRSLIADGGF